MKFYNYFDVTRPLELPTIEDIVKYEQQYTDLLNSDVSDKEKGAALGGFGGYLFKLGDDMSVAPYSKEVSDRALKLGIKLLLKGAELEDPLAKRIVESLIDHGGYKNFGIPSESNSRRL